jgi:hypothetical protein
VMDGCTLSQKHVAEMHAKLEANHAEKRRELETELHHKLMKEEQEINGPLLVHKAQCNLVTKLQRLWRSYRARRSLGEILQANLFKRYDGASHSAYYVNMRTGNSFWTKPAFIGGLTIEYMDEWVACTDSFGDTYYLNPFRKAIEYTDELAMTLMN